MTKQNVTVKFGGTEQSIEIEQFDNLSEAKSEFPPSELLKLINYAYRLKQLHEARKGLERHPLRKA